MGKIVSPGYAARTSQLAMARIYSQLVKLGREAEAEKLYSARGAYDNSAITERGIMGRFYDALEAGLEKSWAGKIGLAIDADAEVINHRFLGAVPKFREWIGGLNMKGLNNYAIQIENKDFEATVGISTHDWRRDKTGQIDRKINELAQQAIVHWEELLVAFFSANPTAYDLVAFFSASHVHGDSGTLKNILTSTEVGALDVTTATAPTKSEATLALAGCMAYALKMRDDKNRKFNQGAREFLALVPTNLYPSMNAAAMDELTSTGGTPELKNLQMKVVVVCEPDLDALSTSQFYLFRTDGPSSRPVILQTEVDPYVDVIGPESEHAKIHNEVLLIGKTTRNVGPGEFKHAFRATLS